MLSEIKILGLLNNKIQAPDNYVYQIHKSYTFKIWSYAFNDNSPQTFLIAKFKEL